VAADTRDIFEAISAGDLDAVKELVAHDPALVAARDEHGLSAVTQAAYHWHREIVDCLLATEPELDAFEAATVGRTERLRELVEKDPELATAFSPDGFTALHLASFFGHEEIARLLLAAGADPGAVARNSMRVQPLHSAAATRQLEIARLLIEAGADVNESQERGFTPLHEAALNDDVELARLLIEHGADPDRSAEDGREAADFARERGSEQVLAVLGKRQVG
jgi:ankyrin repeat protein